MFVTLLGWGLEKRIACASSSNFDKVFRNQSFEIPATAFQKTPSLPLSNRNVFSTTQDSGISRIRTQKPIVVSENERRVYLPLSYDPSPSTQSCGSQDFFYGEASLDKEKPATISSFTSPDMWISLMGFNAKSGFLALSHAPQQLLNAVLEFDRSPQNQSLSVSIPFANDFAYSKKRGSNVYFVEALFPLSDGKRIFGLWNREREISELMVFGDKNRPVTKGELQKMDEYPRKDGGEGISLQEYLIHNRTYPATAMAGEPTYPENYISFLEKGGYSMFEPRLASIELPDFPIQEDWKNIEPFLLKTALKHFHKNLGNAANHERFKKLNISDIFKEQRKGPFFRQWSQLIAQLRNLSQSLDTENRDLVQDFLIVMDLPREERFKKLKYNYWFELNHLTVRNFYALDGAQKLYVHSEYSPVTNVYSLSGQVPILERQIYDVSDPDLHCWLSKEKCQKSEAEKKLRNRRRQIVREAVRSVTEEDRLAFEKKWGIVSQIAVNKRGFLARTRRSGNQSYALDLFSPNGELIVSGQELPPHTFLMNNSGVSSEAFYFLQVNAESPSAQPSYSLIRSRLNPS